MTSYWSITGKKK